ncbi:MAG: AAA family ATPase [Thermoplasmatota archaeon]
MEDHGGDSRKENLVLALCGMPGSGKGEIAEIASELSIPILSMGDIVRERFSADCPGRAKAETGIFADEQRKAHGKDIWARRLIDRMNGIIEGGARIAIIDGLRSRYESDLFREAWGDRFKVLAVHSSPGDRYRRLLVRGRGDDPSNRDEFDERDSRELGWGLGDVISTADIMMVNDGSIEVLMDAARDLLLSLEGGG